MADTTNLFALLDAADENADPEQLAAKAKVTAAKPAAAPAPAAAAKPADNKLGESEGLNLGGVACAAARTQPQLAARECQETISHHLLLCTLTAAAAVALSLRSQAVAGCPQRVMEAVVDAAGAVTGAGGQQEGAEEADLVPGQTAARWQRMAMMPVSGGCGRAIEWSVCGPDGMRGLDSGVVVCRSQSPSSDSSCAGSPAVRGGGRGGRGEGRGRGGRGRGGGRYDSNRPPRREFDRHDGTGRG